MIEGRIEYTGQPDVVKFTDNGVRKLMLKIRHGHLEVSIVVDDPYDLNLEIEDVAYWVYNGDET